MVYKFLFSLSEAVLISNTSYKLREFRQPVLTTTWLQISCSVAKSRPALCDPVDCGPPGSSVHGILLARVLAWATVSFSGDLPRPGVKAQSPALQVPYHQPPAEPPASACVLTASQTW